jgi:hypothetical protein
MDHGPMADPPLLAGSLPRHDIELANVKFKRGSNEDEIHYSVRVNLAVRRWL